MEPVSVEASSPIESAEQEENQKYEIVAEKGLERKGWITNRNSALVNGIEGFVKGGGIQEDKIYILFRNIKQKQYQLRYRKRSFYHFTNRKTEN
ncbi:hypothetical protein OVA29_21715 [Exiguobacterium sp. SL14]|nr:hypothetical protein [Exiguobacterium sp. SL14]